MGRPRHKILSPPPALWPIPGASYEITWEAGSGQRLILQSQQAGAGTDLLLAMIQPGGIPGASIPLQVAINTPELAAQAAIVGLPIPDGWDRAILSVPVAAGPLQALTFFIIDPDGCYARNGHTFPR